MLKRALNRLFRSLSLLALFVLPTRTHAARLYAALGEGSSLCHEKQYLNLGYWVREPQRLDEAGDDLARLVADAAGFTRGMAVLDVGFGFADQDVLWVREYDVRSVHGINCSALQVEAGRRKVAALGLQSRVVLEQGDAVRLSYPASRFDAVVCVEAAFHFDTREDFLREAHRVLRPGGSLAMVDLCAAAGPIDWPARMQAAIGRAFWQIPRQNMYDANRYAERLRSAGFAGVSVESIWPQVYPRFIDFARSRLREGDARNRMNPAFRAFLSVSANARKRIRPTLMDYVLVRAKKPLGAVDFTDAHVRREH